MKIQNSFFHPSFLIISLFSTRVMSGADGEIHQKFQRKIVITHINPPNDVRLASSNGPGIVIGALLGGGLGAGIAQGVGGGVDNERAKKLAEAINKTQVHLNTLMSYAVKNELQKMDFKVEFIPDVPKVLNWKDDFSDIHTDGEAILYVWFGPTGYRMMSSGKAYAPWVIVYAKMIFPNAKSMTEEFSFCAGFKEEGHAWDFLPLDDAPKYRDWESVVKNSPDVVDLLKDTHGRIAKRMAKKIYDYFNPSN